MGNIWQEDSLNDVLYKMNEHMSHILHPLKEFNRNEVTMQTYVREHEHLPLIMRTFEEMPSNLEMEIKFVEKIDYQLIKIKELYEEMVYRSMDLRNSAAADMKVDLALAPSTNDLINQFTKAMIKFNHKSEKLLRDAESEAAFDTVM